MAIEETEQDLLREDMKVMFQYAIHHGKELPRALSLTDSNIENYNNLQKIIAPSTVESIRYLKASTDGAGPHAKWYNITIFKKCIWIAFAALILLCSISLSATVNVENQAKSLLESSGMTLLVNLIFICSAALLGVMFYLLKTFGDKIKNTTLVPSDGVQLNAAILIGVISGFIISELFSFSIAEISTQYIEFEKMTLALLGGFSSDAIFSILQGIVNKIKGVITPSATES